MYVENFETRMGENKININEYIKMSSYENGDIRAGVFFFWGGGDSVCSHQFFVHCHFVLIFFFVCCHRFLFVYFYFYLFFRCHRFFLSARYHRFSNFFVRSLSSFYFFIHCFFVCLFFYVSCHRFRSLLRSRSSFFSR